MSTFSVQPDLCPRCEVELTAQGECPECSYSASASSPSGSESGDR